MNKYKYVGSIEIQLNGYGIVQPQEVIEVGFEVSHPDFKLQKVEKVITSQKK